jgi:hypothetical protein
MAILLAPGQDNYPEHAVLLKIYELLGYASAVVTSVTTFVEYYQEVWKGFHTIDVAEIGKFKEQILAKLRGSLNSIEITNNGLKDMMKNISNTQCKGCI